jgi:hypothetical protein
MTGRSDFGPWGAQLGRDDFAQALAAVGLLAGDQSRDLSELLAGEAPRWQLFSLPPRELDPYELAARWSAAQDRARGPLRLAIYNWPPPVSSPSWLAAELARPVVGIDGLFVEAEPSDASTRWRWPIKLAILDEEQSDLRANISEDPSWLIRDFTRLVDIDGPDPCDLLLVPHALRPAVARIVERRLSAGMIAFLGPMGEPWSRGQSLIQTLMGDAGANAVAFAPVAGTSAEWLNWLLWNLSHDSTVDQALLQTARELKLATPLLFAQRSFLDETRITRVRDRLALRVDAALAEARDLPNVERIESLRYEVERVRRVPVEHEHLAAAETAGIAPEVELLPPTPRFIQAQLYEEREGDRARVAALRTGAVHELAVRVGPSEADWIAAPEKFPEEELPPADEHRLDVILVAPGLLDEPQSGEIVLPERGASNSYSFWLRTPTEEGPLDGRLIVLHEGRILQTALLRGTISNAAQPVTPNDEFRLDTEAVVHSLADLAGRTRFDGALIANHDRANVERLTVVAGGQFDVREPNAFAGAIAGISAKLEDVVTAENGATSLRDGALRELLVFLARHGSLLYVSLLDLHGGSVLAAGERIQILAADAEAFFPLEFVYDRLSPEEDAALCPNAEQALASGVCEGCPAKNDRTFVCPLGFWGLSKVIERHVHDPDAAAQVQGDFRVTNAPSVGRRRLRPLTSVVFAASKQVDEFRPGTIAALRKQIRTALGTKAIQPRSWPDWVGDVKRASPPLLVLLPHTEKDQAQLSTLVIEEREQLAVDKIDDEYVGVGGPIVLLLGCRTGDPTIAFQCFPAAFRRAQAPIVLATLTKVLGRHAGKVAGAVVTSLAEQASQREVTFGEVMREVRRALLAAGMPTVLALTAYGDADWVLGPDGG